MRPAALLLALAPLAAFAAEPQASIDPATRAVVVGHLNGVLDAPEVASHLDSGLTNTFLIDATLHPGTHPGAHGTARIDIRWELWDEIYVVDVVAFDGEVTHAELPSRQALETWWHQTRFPILDGRELSTEERSAVTLAIAFVPFSQSEGEAARRWVQETRHAPEAQRPGPNQPEGHRVAAVVDLVVATSIVRRAIFLRKWTVTLQAGGEG